MAILSCKGDRFHVSDGWCTIPASHVGKFPVISVVGNSQEYFFRRYFGISIASSFLFGTGILIIGVAAIVETLSLPNFFLNAFLYGASVNANLSSDLGALIVCTVVSLVWAVVYNALGTYVLSKSDVY